ncbi:YheC/YheD family protein [Fictibacillus enclensis]|uniref:YheC/YheD family endospore coat-associated protein n=1 Tax=Fictibacillus enclensis TaxID=1017270 RepID=UPI0025A1034D|nr:YheC/YheD family protein [Fictibacillus enclensis]MDM5336827.1 YheC/YheD family protein [Fictibacillus enclensis]
MTILPLYPYKTEKAVFFIPEWLLLDTGKPVTLSFGSSTVTCTAIAHARDELRLSSPLWTALQIPFASRVHIHIQGSSLEIGPLAGIFTSHVGFSSSRPAGERSSFFAKLLSAARPVGSYYFLFGPKQIDLKNRIVYGYFHDGTRWTTHSVPLPSVIYNQIPTRKTENSPSCQKALHLFQNEWKIPVFNPSFFNKQEISQMMSGDSETGHYLPETFIDADVYGIERMLNTYPVIFFKPAGGSFGRGISTVSKLKNGNYICRFQDGPQLQSMNFGRLSDLLHSRKLVSQKEKVLVQQGIDLITIGQSPVDFRIHSNKNRHGQWVISAIAAKVAGSQALTTHLSYGGEARRPENALELAGMPSPVLIKLKQAALKISKKIDAKTDGLIGEIGFDMGIDKQGRIWLIEANSRPGRSLLSHSLFRKEDYLTRRLSLEYGIHLAEQAFLSKPLIHAR